jgi:hypothetical protein
VSLWPHRSTVRTIAVHALVAATTLNSVTKIESARLQQPQEDDALAQVIRAAAERRRQAASRPRSGYHDEKGVWHR